MYNAVALTYLEAHTLHQSVLPAILLQYPLAMQQLRTGVLQEAFRMVRTPPPLTSSSIAIQHSQPPGGLTRGSRSRKNSTRAH